jgi:hypothetical protein
MLAYRTVAIRDAIRQLQFSVELAERVGEQWRFLAGRNSVRTRL